MGANYSLSSSHHTTTERVLPDSNHCEQTADFVRWSLAQLQINFRESPGLLRVQLPEFDHSAFDGQAEIELALDKPNDQETQESLDWNSRFGLWLCKRLLAGAPALHLRPHEQPNAVKDISERLLKAYRVDGGNVHLGGCQLTDYPFLRLSFAANDNGDCSLRHFFVALDGSSVSDKLAKELCFSNLERIKKLPPRIDSTTLDTMIATGLRTAAKMSTVRDPSAVVVDPVLVSLIWVKRASSQIQFTIGDATTTLSFSGWAKLLRAQPYIAAHSGASTFHLAATDDGRIDAHEQISTCQQSGQRVLLQDLVTCSVTQKKVMAEHTQICPVSGQPALHSEFSACNVCRQSVSKGVLETKICKACHTLVKIKKDDPRLVWILGEHAGLARWGHWQFAETQHVYIAQASSFLKRLLVVVDKESLAICHMATASRMSSDWLPVSEVDAAELLMP